MMKMTPSKKNMLTNIADGKAPTHGLSGKSAFGGATGTWASLHRDGLLKDGDITPDGLAAIGREVTIIGAVRVGNA
jgi:hypothetical protein